VLKGLGLGFSGVQGWMGRIEHWESTVGVKVLAGFATMIPLVI
jgi:hypothetical protein